MVETVSAFLKACPHALGEAELVAYLHEVKMHSLTPCYIGLILHPRMQLLIVHESNLH